MNEELPFAKIIIRITEEANGGFQLQVASGESANSKSSPLEAFQKGGRFTNLKTRFGSGTLSEAVNKSKLLKDDFEKKGYEVEITQPKREIK